MKMKMLMMIWIERMKGAEHGVYIDARRRP